MAERLLAWRRPAVRSQLDKSCEQVGEEEPALEAVRTMVAATERNPASSWPAVWKPASPERPRMKMADAANQRSRMIIEQGQSRLSERLRDATSHAGASFPPSLELGLEL